MRRKCRRSARAGDRSATTLPNTSMRRALFAASLFFLVQTGQSYGEAPPVPEVDRSGKGAVLCSRLLTIHVRELAQRCHPDAAKEFIATADWAIGQIDRFIIENSAVTQARLDEDRAAYAKSKFPASAPRERICQRANLDPGREYYLSLKPADFEKIREQTREQLSVPRKPLMNPCL